MKATAFLIFCAGILITLDNRVVASTSDERKEKRNTKGVKKEVAFPRPNFPSLILPSFSSFSLPALNFPHLKAFSHPSLISSSERVRATKTEYVEVTRRQTIHPVCYTAYEAKTPCLPYSQSDFHEDDYDNSEFEAVYQSYGGFNLNEVKKVVQSTTTTTKQSDFVKEENSEGGVRSGKYLELKLRKGAVENSSRIEGSELFPSLNRVPVQHQDTEHYTKTVLITKLEKYVDRRVTATLLAVNCLPVDRGIPMCQNYPSPIREAPDHRSDDDINFQANSYSPTITESENLKLENIDKGDVESEVGLTIEKTGPPVGSSVIEQAEMNSQETSLDNDWQSHNSTDPTVLR